MPLSSRHQHLLLGCALALLTVGSLAIFIVLRGGRSRLAPVLPARETVALFQDMDHAGLARFVSLFPVLHSVPSSAKEPFDVALLAMPGNAEPGWMLLQQSGSSDDWTISFSAEQLRPLLDQDTDRLDDDAGYRELAKHLSDQEPSAYVKLSALEPHQDGVAEAFVRSMGGAAASVLFTLQKGEERLHVYADETSAWTEADMPPSFAVFSPAPSFALFLSHPTAMFTAFLQTRLSSGRASNPPVDEYLLAGLLRERLGKDISLRYDLLPLFANPALLVTGKTGSGSLSSFLANGETQDRDETASRLQKLHERIRTHLSSFSVTRRTFDKGSTMVTMQASPIETRAEQRDGWDIVQTAGTGSTSAGFFTAVSARRFLMSDNREWFLQALNAKPESPSDPLLLAPMLAGGEMNGSLLATEKNFSLLSPILETLGDHVRWTIIKEGKVTTVTVKY